MRTCFLLFLIVLCLSAFGQSRDLGNAPAPQLNQSSQVKSPAIAKEQPDELTQELDVNSAVLSKIPADPLVQPDPLAAIFRPIDTLTERLAKSDRLKFGATYTFLNQYATIVPDDAARHNQLSGRFDFTEAWTAYDHGNSAGSISLLVRSGTNIGVSQQFNLSDRIGSGLSLNSLQGSGPQEPITVNILYWRQDLLKKRLSFYVGKIHPNQYVTLSMFNNDERTQFLNGADDGNVAVASDGIYAGGAAVEFQATPHVYIHAVTVDTEGAQQRNLETLVDRKYMQSVELGWSSGTLGQQYRHYRIGMWRDDTKNSGSGFGGGFGFEHEFHNGWTPFGRFAFGTNRGTAIKQIEGIGMARVHPFGRTGDMFGVAADYSEPSRLGKHHESVFESFYRLRLTQSMSIGPDIEVSIHPTYSPKAYTTTLLGARMEII
ncbi:MAG TPA: carbohydrate porin, partial [Acidobacteriaceae bacterium]|nr:carbohydrate porin [Acidobacteriaceae bacterium]